MLTYCDLVFASGFAFSKFQGVFASESGYFFGKKKVKANPKKKNTLKTRKIFVATLQIGGFDSDLASKKDQIFGGQNFSFNKNEALGLLGLCFLRRLEDKEKKTGNCLKRSAGYQVWKCLSFTIPSNSFWDLAHVTKWPDYLLWYLSGPAICPQMSHVKKKQSYLSIESLLFW